MRALMHQRFCTLAPLRFTFCCENYVARRVFLFYNIDILIYIYIYIYIYRERERERETEREIDIREHIPALCSCVAAAWGASFSRKKTKTPLDVEHIYYQCCWFSLIWVPLIFFPEKMAVWSNDYASKTRIEILCKTACCIAPNHFPMSDLLGNAWKYRTLAGMSTWTLLYLALEELGN